jgi:hypothetical protein
MTMKKLLLILIVLTTSGCGVTSRCSEFTISCDGKIVGKITQCVQTTGCHGTGSSLNHKVLKKAGKSPLPRCTGKLEIELIKSWSS